MAKLTKIWIEALPGSASGQETRWDSELRGFGGRVLPSRLKTSVIQYRNADGRSRRLTLACYGVLTVEQARVEADICDWYLEEAESGRLLSRRRPATRRHRVRSTG